MGLDSPRRSPPSKTRLHKFLAHSGVGSRRACEALMLAGRVTVNGRVADEPGVSVDPARDAVCVDGRPVRAEKKVYLVLNKPRDVLCTSRDPRGRRTFRDLLPPLPERVYTVGRLDRDSEGLLLVTNDGDLTNALTHPRHDVPKVYRVWVSAPLSEQQQRVLCAGIESEGEMLRAVSVSETATDSPHAAYRVVLRQGRNRQIRRMVEAIGLEVVRLQRVEMGPLRLEGLRSGKWRALRDDELRSLRSAVQPRDRVVGCRARR